MENGKKINKFKVVACNNVISALFKKYVNNAKDEDTLENYYCAVKILQEYFSRGIAEKGVSFEDWFSSIFKDTNKNNYMKEV